MPDIAKRIERLERFMRRQEQMRKNRELTSSQGIEREPEYYATILMTLASVGAWDEVIPIPMTKLDRNKTTDKRTSKPKSSKVRKISRGKKRSK